MLFPTQRSQKNNNTTLESFLSLPSNTSQERFQTRSNKGEGRKEGRKEGETIMALHTYLEEEGNKH
jgi:hypothetical protein